MVQADANTILLPQVHLGAIVAVCGPGNIGDSFDGYLPTATTEEANAAVVVISETEGAARRQQTQADYVPTPTRSTTTSSGPTPGMGNRGPTRNRVRSPTVQRNISSSPSTSAERDRRPRRRVDSRSSSRRGRTARRATTTRSRSRVARRARARSRSARRPRSSSPDMAGREEDRREPREQAPEVAPTLTPGVQPTRSGWTCGHLRSTELRHLPQAPIRRYNSAGQPIVQSAAVREQRKQEKAQKKAALRAAQRRAQVENAGEDSASSATARANTGGAASSWQARPGGSAGSR